MNKSSKKMITTEEHQIVFVTCPTEESATNIANILVTEKLVACCNIINKVKSIYYWDEKVCHDNEVLMIIKSRRDKLEKMEARIQELHEYDIPEILAIPISDSSEKYLNWIDNTLSR